MPRVAKPLAALPAASRTTGAAWVAAAGAWRLDDRIIHMRTADTRDLVSMTLSTYAFRIVVGTMRDGEDRGWFVGQVLDEHIGVELVEEIADAITLMHFGLPRWTVQRLWGEALARWRDVDGELSARGADVLAMAPDRATNAVYALLRRAHSHDQRDLEKWLKGLDTAPPRTIKTERGADDAAADWMAAAAAAGMPVTVPAVGVDSELIITSTDTLNTTT